MGKGIEEELGAFVGFAMLNWKLPVAYEVEILAGIGIQESLGLWTLICGIPLQRRLTHVKDLLDILWRPILCRW
jgi:hypothetical protein